MTAFPCPTCGCESKDDQIAALVEALEALLEAGPEFGRCVCGRKFFQEHRRGCAWIKALHVHADIPAAARERAEERERLRKQIVGQKRTLHKVKNKWDVSEREGERLAAALAHLLAWVQPSASQQAEAEVETAIEELEDYRKAHPRRAALAGEKAE